MKIAQILLLAALAVVSGCDSEGRIRPPQTGVRFFHAAPNFADFTLFRERRPEAGFEFGGGTTMYMDSGAYDFGLEWTPPGAGQPGRVDFREELTPGEQHVFVAVAPGDQPQMLIASIPNLTPGTSGARYSVIDAHPDLGPVDIYMVPAGTPLNGALVQGSIDFGPVPATFVVTAQVLRLYLTPAGDPGTILFESNDFTASAGTDNLLVVHDTGGQTPADLAVSHIGNTAVRINQLGQNALLRVVQGVDDRQSRDILLDDDVTTPLFAAQAFGDLSDYVEISPAIHTLKVTPVGQPGTEEETVSFTPLPGRYYTAMFSGDTNTGIQSRIFIEDPRAIVQQASLHALNVAGMFDSVLIYIASQGTDYTTTFPRINFAAPDFTTRLAFVPGEYELAVVDRETQALLAGPVQISLAEQGLYGVLLLNAADNVTIDLDYFYDFAQ